MSCTIARSIGLPALSASVAIMAFLTTVIVIAQESVVYSDGVRGEVIFPQGPRSFADEVVSFEVGSPNAGEVSMRPRDTLGPPDYSAAGDANYLTLGCAGTLVLAFTDNSLVDTPGPDLHVFEIGPYVEATGLAISEDGVDWVRVGRIEGGKSAVDIAAFAQPGVTYRYVKLVDLKQSCRDYPGADIDAVGAIGSARTITLDSAVLFDTGQYVLREAATSALSDVAGELAMGATWEVVVDGHTDNVGSDSDNQVLAMNRAESVANYLSMQPGLEGLTVSSRSFGESRPVATNDTAEGRQRNRRVEITLLADTESTADVQPTQIIGIWDSSEGLMELRMSGNEVSGGYGDGDGQLTGAFSQPDEFNGYWVQPGSSQACATDREGSRYWGRIQLRFDSADRNVFSGYWSYCDAEPTTAGWDGSRLL